MKQARILVIEDDTSFKKILEIRLKSFLPGLSFTSYSSIQEAQIGLQSQKPTTSDILPYDLVVLDQHLPDGEGLTLLKQGWFEGLAVLSVSSDTAPQLPGANIQAGATFFLNKVDVSAPLFEPLVLGILDRNRLSHELIQSKLDAAVMEGVKKLVDTLRHEINNPLGVVMGAAYILNRAPAASAEQKEAAALVEASGKRIQHVIEQLNNAVSLETVKKAHTEVFHIPGDKPWESGE